MTSPPTSRRNPSESAFGRLFSRKVVVTQKIHRDLAPRGIATSSADAKHRHQNRWPPSSLESVLEELAADFVNELQELGQHVCAIKTEYLDGQYYTKILPSMLRILPGKQGTYSKC